MSELKVFLEITKVVELSVSQGQGLHHHRLGQFTR